MMTLGHQLGSQKCNIMFSNIFPISMIIRKQKNQRPLPSNTNSGGGLSTVDLLIKVACFCKRVRNIFKIKKFT